MSDVAALIVFHGERLLAAASIASFARCCDLAARRGVSVTRFALLDRPDIITQDAVVAARHQFDHIETVGHGDLGVTRNAGVALTTAKYVAFFDGDDLWGEDWIFEAHLLAERLDDRDAVFHPRVVARFSPDDHRIQSRTAAPPRDARSHFFIHQDSRNAGFDPRTLLFCNVWTANALSHRSVHERFPYRAADRTAGFAIEDWTWNMETLAHGIKHVVVPDTVHCIRMKPEGSLARRLQSDGLVPPIHEFATRLEADWAARVATTGTPI